MKRLHIIGGKNHGKTKLIVDLVKEFTQRGVSVGTIKHTHHAHELDIPGKDSTAMFLPIAANEVGGCDRYSAFAPAFALCRFILVEGDSQAQAPKIEVWRKDLETPPMANRDQSVLAVVTDDPPSTEAHVLRRSDIAGLANWILRAVGKD
jgi:molybdopterin-guanine dinucleotide biosynthesis protein B